MKASEWVEQRMLARATAFAQRMGMVSVPDTMLLAMQIAAILEVLDAFEGVELKLPNPKKDLPP